MEQWEYISVEAKDYGDLNFHGQQRWEAVCLVNSGMSILMKRKILPASTLKNANPRGQEIAEQWEYKSVRKICCSPDFDAEFNELGKEGWEMVAAMMVKINFDNQLTPTFFFKRKILEPTKKDMPNDMDGCETGT
jgi:hypothetical protein